MIKVSQPAIGVWVGMGVTVNVDPDVAVGGGSVGVGVSARIVRADPLEGRVVRVLFP